MADTMDGKDPAGTIRMATIYLDDRGRKVVGWDALVWPGKVDGLLAPPPRYKAEFRVQAMEPQGGMAPQTAIVDLQATTLEAAYAAFDKAVREFVDQINGPKILTPAPRLAALNGEAGKRR